MDHLPSPCKQPVQLTSLLQSSETDRQNDGDVGCIQEKGPQETRRLSCMQLFLKKHQPRRMGILRSTSTMASRSRTAALVCLSVVYGTPTVRGESLLAVSRQESTNAELLIEATKLRRVGTRTCPAFRCWVSDHNLCRQYYHHCLDYCCCVTMGCSSRRYFCSLALHSSSLGRVYVVFCKRIFSSSINPRFFSVNASSADSFFCVTAPKPSSRQQQYSYCDKRRERSATIALPFFDIS